MLVAVNAKTGQTLAQTKGAMPYFVLGFDQKVPLPSSSSPPPPPPPPPTHSGSL